MEEKDKSEFKEIYFLLIIEDKNEKELKFERIQPKLIFSKTNDTKNIKIFKHKIKKEKKNK